MMVTHHPYLQPGREAEARHQSQMHPERGWVAGARSPRDGYNSPGVFRRFGPAAATCGRSHTPAGRWRESGHRGEWATSLGRIGPAAAAAAGGTAVEVAADIAAVVVVAVAAGVERVPGQVSIRKKRVNFWGILMDHSSELGNTARTSGSANLEKARRLALLVVKRDTYRRAALAGASAGAGERGAKSYLGRSSSLEGRLYAMMGEGKEDGKLLFPVFGAAED